MKRFLSLLLLSALPLVSCHSNNDDPAVVPDDPDPVDQSLRIVTSGVSDYSIAYTGDVKNAEGLQKALKDLTGAELPLYRAWDKEGAKEILVGTTSRQETQDVLKELGDNEGFIISVVGEKLVIAGTGDVWTALALRAFQTKVLFSKTYLSDKSLTLTRVFKTKESYKDPMLIARLLQKGLSFSLFLSEAAACTGDAGMTVAQGAASDGQYFYFVNRTSDEKQSAVYRVDMQTKALAGRTEPFYAGHCNDMTYDAVKKQLIIAHGQSEGKILTPVDLATFKALPDVTISVGSGAIAYNATRRQYAISQGGSTFYVTDGSFKVVVDKRRTDSTGYTAQGMGCDDDYVYFPMSGSSDNVLVAYDWNGNYAATLTVPTKLESESMFYAAGQYYVNFYAGSGKGAKLYQITPLYSYTYSK